MGSVFPFGFTDILAVAAEGSSCGAHFLVKGFVTRFCYKVLSMVLVTKFIFMLFVTWEKRFSILWKIEVL